MLDPHRVIVHADMDAFYAAVEQRDNPELRGKPVIVGGTRARGVVLTASYEARAFGVHSAMPAAEAHRLCPDGVFVSPRMQEYARVAHQIRAVFSEFTPLVEPLSLDEAFLDVTGSLTLLGSPMEIGRNLKQRVRASTGLIVSVGIGPTKMIAKIASARSKPDGLLEVRSDQVRRFLDPLPVSELWGVGPATQRALERLGISTVGALTAADRSMLVRRLGRAGDWLFSLANGDDRRAVDPRRERKSYGEEQTFDRDLADGERLRRAIAEQAESVARRLRAHGRRGRTVTLKLKLARRLAPGKYPVSTRRATLPQATDDGRQIAAAAVQLWDAVHGGRQVRLIGVSVSGIEDGGGHQMSLFDAGQRQRHENLERTLDALRARFGPDSVRRGG